MARKAAPLTTAGDLIKYLASNFNMDDEIVIESHDQKCNRASTVGFKVPAILADGDVAKCLQEKVDASDRINKSGPWRLALVKKHLKRSRIK